MNWLLPHYRTLRDNMPRPLRQLSQRLGAEHGIALARRIRSKSLRGWSGEQIARRRYLRRSAAFRPVAAGPDALEVHMLLQRTRVYEALWTLYSLSHFSGRSLRPVIHDDGSLQRADAATLRGVFPDATIVPRRQADATVAAALAHRGLARCLAFRRGHILALKLIDPFFWAGEQGFVVLDSDVLFFDDTSALTGGQPAGARGVYSVDNGYNYALTPEELRDLLGRACVAPLNSGVMRVYDNRLDLELLEAHLAHPGFWAAEGTPSYWTEMTLWATEMTRRDALPLPQSYGICTTPDMGEVTSGHFCGGRYWATRYYSVGLPYLEPRLA